MKSIDPKRRHSSKHKGDEPQDDRGTTDKPPFWQEPRGIQKGIADADKKARTGSTEEHVRETPPAGPWNDTSSD
jgi:hypothetical protein